MQIINKKTPAEIFYSQCMGTIASFERKKNYIFSSAPQKNIIILCYHSVDNGGWRFSVPINNFRKQMEYLKSRHRILSLPEALETDRTMKSGGVVVTFDDGYLDVFENALPILKELNIPAAMFAIGESGLANRKELNNEKELLNIEHMRHLREEGWTIGFHTKTHSCLRNLDDARYCEEIVAAKEEFEKKIGFSVDYFAYPRGIYSDKIIDNVRKAGFKAAFTVDGGAASGKNIYAVNRISIEGRTNDEEFEAIFSPLGLKFTKFFVQTLKMKESLFSKDGKNSIMQYDQKN